MDRKYEFTGETRIVGGVVLHRIRAVRDIYSVNNRHVIAEKGDIGGWIEKEENLSHDGECWVKWDSCVHGNARVCGNAVIFGNSSIFNDACVYSKIASDYLFRDGFWLRIG